MSENEEKVANQSEKEDVPTSETAENSDENIELKTEENNNSEETDNLEEESEEVHEVLPYPERVPNAEKGADHAHSYVMIKILVLLVVFSLVIAKFTSPF